MKIIHLFTAIIVLTILSCSPKLEDGIYAKVNTNKGEIQLQLTYDQTPVTVANFMSLAEGTNTQVDSIYSGKPSYDDFSQGYSRFYDTGWRSYWHWSGWAWI